MKTLQDFKAQIDQMEKGASAKLPAEKDPRENGTVTPPTHPGGTPAAQSMPSAQPTNSDTTPVVTPSLTPAKTIHAGTEQVKDAAKKLTDTLAKVIATAKTAGVKAAGCDPNANTNLGAANQAKTTQVDPSTPPNTQKNTDKSSSGDTAALPKDKTEKGKVEVVGDSKGQLPPDATNADTTKKANAEGVDPLANPDQFTAEFHVKIAQAMLSTEEGRMFVTSQLKAQFGAEQAEGLVKAASYYEGMAEALQSEEMQYAELAQKEFAAKSPAEQQQIIKMANAHAMASSQFQTLMEKQAYQTGAGAADELAAGGMAGEELPPDYNAEQVQDTDIVAVLEQLIAEGKLTEEQAAAILQQTMGAEAGLPGVAGMAGGEGGPGLPPGVAEPPMEEEPAVKEARATIKMASAALKVLEPEAAPATK